MITQLEQLKAQMDTKVNEQDLALLQQLVDTKMDSEESLQLLGQSRTEIYEDLNILKTELNHAKKANEDLTLEKTRKLERTLEKINHSVGAIKDQNKHRDDQRKTDESEQQKYNTSLLSALKKEIFFELERITTTLDQMKSELEEEMDRKVYKEVIFELEAKLESALEEKAEVVEI